MAAAALIAAALLPLSLGGGLAVSYDASLRLEERVRQVRPIPGTPTTDTASEVQPSLTLDAAARTAALGLTYDPRFTWTPGATGPDGTWLHLASLVGTWRPDDDRSLRSVATVTRGTSDLFRFLTETTSSPDGTTVPVAQLTPAVTTIEYQNYDLALSADVRLAPRLSLRASAGGSREGGLGASARDFLPLQQGGRAAAGLDWRLTRTDTLGATVSGSVLHYFDVLVAPGGPVPRESWSVWSGRLGFTWRHGVDRETSRWVGAGLALVGGDRQGQDALRALPSAEVGLSHEPKLRDQRLQGGLALALAPLEDRLAGGIVERADLRGWVTWFPVDRWSLRGAASGGLVVSGSAKGDAIGSADARVGWAATTFMDLSVGLRGSLQHQQNLTVPRFSEWNAYLALSLISKGRP